MPGKGVGMVATKKIKLGTLIIRESPQLLVDLSVNEDFLDKSSRNIRNTVKSFMQMKQTDKDIFMKLFNKFSVNERLLSVTSLKYIEHAKNALENMDLVDISMEEAIAVCQRVNTNAFDNGVCLNISRFNHSCLANAEHFWNDDLETRDVRAIKNIKEGEEIFLNYQASSSYLTRAERQKNIIEGFHFSCHCVAWDLPETEINQLDMKCLRYEELVKKVNMYK